MKLWIISLVLFATAWASLPSEEYLPPLEDTASTNTVDLQTLSDSSALTEDGYHYRTVKRQRYRHRRDVSELPSSEYLPPVGASSNAQPVVDLPVFDNTAAASQESAVLADDGYHYKTVKRYRLRHRRDVSHLPANEYLPPVSAESSEEAATAPEPIVEEVSAEAAPVAAEESAVLADDGYRYKTVKRYRLRHRRDVSHLPANEYLPPVSAESSEAATAPEPVVEEVSAEAAPVSAEESAVLADDGYRYKTVKRYRLRHRRDVSHLPANEYLPPVSAESSEEAATAPEPVVEEVSAEAAPVAAEESAVLADDGYRYKTVKRYRLRHRRDVSHLPANEYLPPVSAESSEAATAPEPVVEEVSAEAAPVAAEESAVLADDGYRYKTVKRYRLRHRRDVSHLPANEYLPPVSAESSEEAATAIEPVVEEVSAEAAPVAAEESAVLADDGYRYKTVKRYRLRHRRDVSHLPANEYLPPVSAESSEAATAPEPVVEEVSAEAAPVAAEESAVLADDGYRYKTVKRYRLRHRRDVSHLPANEYLPPVSAESSEEAATAIEPVVEEVSAEAAPVAAEESAVLADDGYRYKTVKRYRLRHRRDVSHLPANEYLPPVSAESSEAATAPEPVVEEVSAEAVPVAAEESAVLADDGYRYKTVKRYRLRHRRDVSHLPANEYLPPVSAESSEEAATAPEPVVEDVSAEAAPVAAEESAVLADDGYRYKTVKRYRLRHRRDVSHLPANEYLPPVSAESSEAATAPEPVVEEVSAEAAPVAAEESAVLADDGYRYKTVKRYRLRHRRDVSHLPANEYLPPVSAESSEEAATAPEPVVEEVSAEAAPVAAEESAVLADDGYRYKTVKRYRLRQ